MARLMHDQTDKLNTILDCGVGDNRFVLEEDSSGRIYETSNAVTRELVCSAMFSGWGDDYLRSDEWLEALTEQFEGNRSAAERYVRAALDEDK